MGAHPAGMRVWLSEIKQAEAVALRTGCMGAGWAVPEGGTSGRVGLSPAMCLDVACLFQVDLIRPFAGQCPIPWEDRSPAEEAGPVQCIKDI